MTTLARGLLFGTGGTPLSASSRSTVAGIQRIAELDLDCMEIEFVQGVKMSEQSALQVHAVARRHGIRLTAHGPYAINLNSTDPEKAEASRERVLQTARIGALCGAESVVFHAAFYGESGPGHAYQTVKEYLADILDRLHREGNHIWVRPELTGKDGQFGTLEEVVQLSSELEGVAPCIDFAHWHARTGRFNSYEGFTSMLQQVEDTLGRKALDNMHMHVSGIQYGKHGEQEHLPLRESDFQYQELIRALKDFQVKGFVICESPNLEEDALLLQRTFGST
ncbi:MAG: TIM barrel protein [Chloroflexota bacterium]